MKTLLLIICLSLFIIPLPSIAQDDLDSLKALNLGPAWGGIAWNVQGDLLAVGGYNTLTIHDTNFNVVDTLDNYEPGTAFVWSPDGDLFFVTFQDDTYQIVRRSPEGELTTLYDNQRVTRIDNLSINHDATYLAGIEDGQAKIWSIETGEATSISAVKQDVTAVSALAWHPTATKLAIAREQVYIWDMASAELATVSDLPPDIGLLASLGWQSAGDVLAIGTSADIYLWTISTNETVLLAGHADFVRHVAWVGDGWMLASGSDDGTLQLWDTTVPNVLVQFFQPVGQIRSISLQSITQAIYVLDEGGEINAFDPLTQEKVNSFYGYVVPQELGWTADGSAITDGNYVWDVETGSITGAIPTVPLMWSPWAQTVAWNPAGTQVAYSNENNTALIVQVNAGLHELSAPGDYFAWSPDGNWLAAYAEESPTIDIWQDGELYSEIIPFADMNHVTVDLSWDGDSQEVAVLGRDQRDSFVRVYDVATGELVVESEFVLSGKAVMWTTDDTQLWVNSEEQGLYTFDGTTGVSLREFPSFYEVELSPDGSRFIAKYNPAYENTTLGVYDTATLEPIAEIPFDYQTDFGNFVWSPDGTQVAVVLEGVLYVWEP